MTDYTTLSAVKTYLHISGTAHDTLLTELITRASRLVDDHCGRWFGTQVQTRYFDAIGSHISGRLLLFDTDLYSLTSITNGDGVVITPDQVILRPINWPPYFGLALKQGSGLRWGYISDPEGAISVTGAWGYSPTIPEPIVHAAIRLTSWLYRQRDTGGEGAQIEMTDRGVAVAPARLPRDVLDLIGPYVRLRIKVLG
jgi:hypothetical protein